MEISKVLFMDGHLWSNENDTLAILLKAKVFLCWVMIGILTIGKCFDKLLHKIGGTYVVGIKCCRIYWQHIIGGL